MTLKKTLNSIGWKYGLMGVLYIAIEILLGKLIMHFVPESLESLKIYITYAIMVFTVDCVCFPFILLITLKMPKAEIKKKKLGFEKFFLSILIMYGLILVGSLIGSPIHTVLTAPFNVKDDGLAMLMINSNFFVRVFVVGISAPIFEELIFRKVLIDHLAAKGELVAVLASGLMFGLFHGNFQQGFFTAFIGCFFAYIYLRTGKVRYTIFLHMILNCITSGITLELIKWLYKLIEKDFGNIDNFTTETMQAMHMDERDLVIILIPTFLLFAWVLTLFGVMLSGLVTAITFACVKTFKFKRREGDDTFGKQVLALFTSPCMWIFYSVTIFLFGYTYLPPIVSTVKELLIKVM